MPEQDHEIAQLKAQIQILERQLRQQVKVSSELLGECKTMEHALEMMRIKMPVTAKN